MGSKLQFLVAVVVVCGLAYLARNLLDAGRTEGPRSGGSQPGVRVTDDPADPKRISTDPPAEGPAWTILGRVLGSGGQVLPNAEVRLIRPLPNGGRLLLAAATTGQDGSFVLKQDGRRFDLADSAAYLTAVAPRHLPGFEGISVPPVAERRQPFVDSVEMQLRAGTTIRGRVLDPSGKPVSFALMGRESAEPGQPSQSRVVGSTDEQGFFALPLPETGRWRILAWSPGLLEGRSEPIAHDPVADQEIGEIRLSEGLSIEGRIQFEDGTPVFDAPLFCVPDDPRLQAGYRGLDQTSTDLDGYFRLTGLHDARYRVGLSNVWGADSGTSTLAHAGTTDVSLVIRHRRIRLRFQDGNGEPIHGAYLRPLGWRADDPPGARPRFRPVKGLRVESEVSIFLPRDTRWVVAAEFDKQGFAESPLEPEPGQNDSRITLTLSSPRENARLRVSVHGPDGQKIGQYNVDVVSPLLRRHLATLVGGTSREEPPSVEIPAGLVRVEAGPTAGLAPNFFGGCVTEVELRPGEDRLLELEVPVGGRLQLEVRAEPGAMAGFKAQLIPLAGGATIPVDLFLDFALGAAQKTYRLESGVPAIASDLLRPGLYALRVEVPGHAPFQTEVRIEMMEITAVTADLVRQAD